MLALLGLCGVATLLNPYGIRIYLAVYDAGGSDPPVLYLQEFQPRSFARSSTGSCCRHRGRGLCAGPEGEVRSWPGMLLASGVAVAFRTARDVWFGVVAALVVLATHAPRARESVAGCRAGAARGRRDRRAGGGIPRVGEGGSDRLEASWPRRFRLAAAAEIARRGISARCTTTMTGGIPDVASPGLLVSVDGRARFTRRAILRSVATWLAGRLGYRSRAAGGGGRDRREESATRVPPARRRPFRAGLRGRSRRGVHSSAMTDRPRSDECATPARARTAQLVADRGRRSHPGADRPNEIASLRSDDRPPRGVMAFYTVGHMSEPVVHPPVTTRASSSRNTMPSSPA